MLRYAILLLGIFIASTQSAFAFTARMEEVPVQYQVVPISEPEIKQVILGELKDSPEMYEIVSEVPFKLTVSIEALPKSLSTSTANFNGIIIRQKEVRGVEEVARLKSSEASWSEVRNPYTGLSYQSGPYFSQDMASGTYRIEVSTPENYGKYMLVVGDKKDNNGYFLNLTNVAVVYEFYGLSKFRMFSSPYIHYPVGSIFLLGLIYLTWYTTKKRRTKAVEDKK